MEFNIRDRGRIPILSWSSHVEKRAMDQAVHLARHPETFHHVAIMPDCHPGYGMPIGGVIACENSVIPYAVGVDIGCGMVAARSSAESGSIGRDLLDRVVKTALRKIPVGEGHSHSAEGEWEGFSRIPRWMDGKGTELARKSLGTLGGGNHFLEVQEGDDGFIWLMIHSGSRNPGYRIADHHHRRAVTFCRKHSLKPSVEELSWLPVDSLQGRDYLSDMEFALEYASENRRRLMMAMKEILSDAAGGLSFSREVNIHHNYASRENHFDRDVWVHRKGATSAMSGQKGIIPGSMGTHSFIVSGLGNPDSFMSCSHGAGRTMGRKEASRRLSRIECDRSMHGIAFSGWRKSRGWGKRGKGAPELDLSEAPAAYKDIDEVISMQRDLIEPLIRLRPVAVVKG